MIKKAAHDWYMAMVASTIVLVLFIFIWTWAIHTFVPPLITTAYNELVPSYGRPGQMVMLCRDLEFQRPATLTLERSMYRYENGREIRVELDDDTVHREPGKLKQCRDIILPSGLTPGDWRLRTVVTWTDWPFWYGTMLMPEPQLTVLPDR